MRLVLTDAGVGPERGGDGHVPRELGEQPGVERRVVGHPAEAGPRRELGRPDGGVGVPGVRTVHDPEVSSGHRQVVGDRFVRPGHRGCWGGVADHVRSGDVEQQGAAGADPSALRRSGPEHGERPARGHLVELEGVGRAGVGGSGEGHRGRHHPPPRHVAAGGDDGLAEDLAALDHRPAPVAAGLAPKVALSVGPDVEDLDQVGDVAPGGEALGRDVPLVVTVTGVDEGEVDALVVERDVVGQFPVPLPPQAGIEQVEQGAVDIAAREPQDRGAVGDVDPDGGSRFGDDGALARGPSPVGDGSAGRSGHGRHDSDLHPYLS